MTLSFNSLGGAVAVLALAVVIYFGVRQVTCPPPQSVVKVTYMGHHARPPAQPKRPTVYRKVLPGGKLGEAENCKWVPPVARQYSKEQVLAAASQYGLPPAQIEALRVCLN